MDLRNWEFGIREYVGPEKWGTGEMGHWRDGALGRGSSNAPMLHRSNAPTPQRSNALERGMKYVIS